jgi:hypothetical protein
MCSLWRFGDHDAATARQVGKKDSLAQMKVMNRRWQRDRLAAINGHLPGRAMSLGSSWCHEGLDLRANNQPEAQPPMAVMSQATRKNCMDSGERSNKLSLASRVSAAQERRATHDRADPAMRPPTMYAMSFIRLGKNESCGLCGGLTTHQTG